MPVDPREFIHPEDAAAQEQLEEVPLFDQFVKLFLRVLPEQAYHIRYMSNGLRLGPKQLPDVYRHLTDCSALFGIKPPELYLVGDGTANAFAIGESRTMIVLHSGLLQACSEEELRAVIAHECGHIVCRHTFYRTMALFLIEGGAKLLGPLGAAVIPIQLALLYWSRRSELSADRAAAVAMGGSEPVVHMMVRLSGGPREITGEVDIDEYVKQAEAYDRLGENAWNKMLKYSAAAEATHPFPAVRAREIIDWCGQDRFGYLVDAIRERPSGAACEACGKTVEADWKFCRFCGTELTSDREEIEKEDR